MQGVTAEFREIVAFSGDPNVTHGR